MDATTFWGPRGATPRGCETASMEWTDETGAVIEWDWAEPRPDDSGAPTERYAIRIRIAGRRLRGAEAQAWKHRIANEFLG